jgi:hypothetical protein
VEKAVDGLYPLWPTMKMPRFSMVGDRRIVRRQTISTAC